MRLLLPVTLIAAVLAAPSPALGWSWPVDGPVLTFFAFDRGHPYGAGQHRGIDIGAHAGSPVAAPVSGSVSFAGSVPSSGKTVTIATTDGYSVTLVRLGSYSVRRGEQVAEQSVVGTVGPTGDSEHSQPYIHLGVRIAADPQGYVDPLGFLPAQPPVAPPPPPVGDPPPPPDPAPAGGPAPPAVAPPPAPALEPAQPRAQRGKGGRATPPRRQHPRTREPARAPAPVAHAPRSPSSAARAGRKSDVPRATAPRRRVARGRTRLREGAKSGGTSRAPEAGEVVARVPDPAVASAGSSMPWGPAIALCLVLAGAVVFNRGRLRARRPAGAQPARNL